MLTSQKCRFLGLTPDLLIQKLCNWGPAICVVTTLQVILILLKCGDHYYTSMRVDTAGVNILLKEDRKTGTIKTLFL